MNYSLKNLKFLLGTLWSRNGSNSDENYLSNLWIISCITFIEITTRHVEWCSSSNPPPSPNQHCSSLLWNSTAHKYTMQSQLGPQQWSGCSVSSCNPNLFFLEKGIYWSGNQNRVHLLYMCPAPSESNKNNQRYTDGNKKQRCGIH